MLLNDLSKAFDCIAQDYLIAKLETYDLSYEALKVMQNYLTGRKHRTEVNDSLRPYLFNITSTMFSFLLKKEMLLAALVTQLHSQTVKML